MLTLGFTPSTAILSPSTAPLVKTAQLAPTVTRIMSAAGPTAPVVGQTPPPVTFNPASAPGSVLIQPTGTATQPTITPVGPNAPPVPNGPRVPMWLAILAGTGLAAVVTGGVVFLASRGKRRKR